MTMNNERLVDAIKVFLILRNYLQKTTTQATTTRMMMTGNVKFQMVGSWSSFLKSSLPSNSPLWRALRSWAAWWTASSLSWLKNSVVFQCQSRVLESISKSSDSSVVVTWSLVLRKRPGWTANFALSKDLRAAHVFRSSLILIFRIHMCHSFAEPCKASAKLWQATFLSHPLAPTLSSICVTDLRAVTKYLFLLAKISGIVNFSEEDLHWYFGPVSCRLALLAWLALLAGLTLLALLAAALVESWKWCCKEVL